MGVETALIAAAVGTAAATVYQGEQQKKATKAAGQQAVAASREQASQADREFNRQNMKRPDVSALVTSNALAARSGNAGTMLTGPGGVNSDALQLQRNTLLGE